MAIIIFKYRRPAKPAILKDYQQKRILAFLEPEKYASDEAYQQNNSEMAIGSGQLTGKGLNNNTTTSVKMVTISQSHRRILSSPLLARNLGLLDVVLLLRYYYLL